MAKKKTPSSKKKPLKRSGKKKQDGAAECSMATADEAVHENRIDVKIGFKCNNFCRFCVQGNKRFYIPRENHNAIKKILKKNAGRCDSVVFTGGEPTMQSAFLELVSFAADNDYKVIQIQTNARAFHDKKFCKRTIAAGATEFSPALHGHIPELHDYLTRSPGSFRETATGILNLKELGMYVGTNTVITRSNFRHLPEIARLLLKLGVDRYQLAFVHAVGRAGINFASVVPRKSMVEPYVKAGLEVGLQAGAQAMSEALPYCFMKGFEHCVSETVMPETKIFDAGNVIESFTDFRLVEGKAKGPRCGGCSWNRICEGPWREYPERYGWDEFVPRDDPPEQ